MKTTTQLSRRGVSHTPQSHTPQSHTPQLHTPQSHTSHHRRSIRLKGYDYSADGLYFITICTKNRQHLFGHVANGEMVLNETGKIVKSEWINTVNVRQGEVILHDFVVMPNHFHAIIEICRGGVCDTHEGVCDTHEGVCDTHEGVCDTHEGVCDTHEGVCDTHEGVCDTPLRSPSKTVGAIARGFKSAVSKKIGFSAWQRNYHEHIIRDSRGFEKISNYIRNNPECWNIDRFNN